MPREISSNALFDKRPETWNPKPETRNLKPGTRNLVTRNPKPETRNLLFLRAQFLKHRKIFQCRNVTGYGTARRQFAQQATHDFPGSRFG
jgi:hypothetical protein